MMLKKNAAYLKEENLLTLLSQNNFIVPEIQREYVWGENEKVITKFLIDLKEKIGVCCSICNLPSSENKINIGFLYSYKPDYVKIENDRFLDENLIDGQQRFTTLFLLLFYNALKETKIDGSSRKEEFLTLIRFEEKLSMSFDFKVRDLTKRFMLELIEKINTIEQLKNIEKQTWFLKDYKNDVSIKSIIKALGYIHSVFINDKTKYYNHILNYVVFWHFKTEATSQGEELYITMNARGEDLAVNEVTKAALMIGGSEIYSWGKNWEEWQQFFWKNRDKKEINPSADKGFNGFLFCIAGLEYYLNEKQGIFIEKDIQKLLTIEKIERYYKAFNLLLDKKEEFISNYTYSDWIQKCLDEIWNIFNKNETDWFIDYKDKNKSTERNRMVFIWSWMYFITNPNSVDVLATELYRLLRFFYVRFNNFNRSVSTLKNTIDLIIKSGVWGTIDNEIGNVEESPEDETDIKFRTTEEAIKNVYFQRNLGSANLNRLEELIWEIEDHPLNLDGRDVGNINITHLFNLDELTTIEELQNVRDTFFNLFPNGIKSGSEILKTVLLYYGEFYKISGYYNGNKYDFSDWKTNIRKPEFKRLINIFKAKVINEHLDTLKTDFLKSQKYKIVESENTLPEGYSLREKLIFYSLILKPEGLWKVGNIIIEYGEIENSRLFNDDNKKIFNLRSDFRSVNVDLWIKAKELNENPINIIKEQIIA